METPDLVLALFDYMIESYRSKQSKCFMFHDLAAQFPDVEKSELSNSLYFLEGLGLVFTKPYDNVPYYTYLELSAINKGSDAVKDEIKAACNIEPSKESQLKIFFVAAAKIIATAASLVAVIEFVRSLV